MWGTPSTSKKTKEADAKIHPSPLAAGAAALATNAATTLASPLRRPARLASMSGLDGAPPTEWGLSPASAQWRGAAAGVLSPTLTQTPPIRRSPDRGFKTATTPPPALPQDLSCLGVYLLRSMGEVGGEKIGDFERA